MARDVVHHISSLTTCEAACGAWDMNMQVVLEVARVSCAACLRRLRATEIPESALLRAVRQAALASGHLFYHTHRSDGSEKGWFDVAIAKPGKPLYLAELKTVRGKLTIEQQRWQTTVTQCTGVRVDIWRPADLPRVLALLKESPHA